MAIIPPRIFDLKGKARCLIRAAVEADAPALLEHQAHMVATDPHTVTEPDELKRTNAEQIEAIVTHAKEPGQLLLVAALTDDPSLPVTSSPGPGLLLGASAFRSGDRRKVRHHGHFGLSVQADWRGRGVGSALITTILDWAAEHPNLEKVCLGTFETNAGAQKLYRRMGFVQESRAPKFFKLATGEYVDDVWMAIYVKPGVAPEGFGTWGEESLTQGSQSTQRNAGKRTG